MSFFAKIFFNIFFVVAAVFDVHIINIENILTKCLPIYVLGSMYFQNALDFNLCMGASESMRQGFVLSNPQDAEHVVSMIGDSSECHSGMDATRNAIYRKIPGVKIVLDNRAIAMTGAQASPTSTNFPLDLVKALEAEGARALRVDAYDRDAVEWALLEALRLAGEGIFTTLVLDGSCIEVVDRSSRSGTVMQVDADLCVQCDSCNICPGINIPFGEIPQFTDLCTQCGNGVELCKSSCPVQAISSVPRNPTGPRPKLPTHKLDITTASQSQEPIFPDALRVAICGVGGQGNLFLGKVLTQVMRSTSYFRKNVIKGDVHGMAQKGGAVWSTFACGNVHSPLFAAGSVDYLVAMERGELLRPQFLRFLKPTGMIILNDHAILPTGHVAEDYPQLSAILDSIISFKKVVVRANEVAPRNANSVMLGILSTLPPFLQIPTEIWIEALRSLSRNDNIAQGNVFGFLEGRQITFEFETT
jgi:indolepyruvate ferredoxin oxidoreductase alpha subunit